MTDPIKVEMEMDDVLRMNVDDKLSALVKIAFSNHSQLSAQGKTLFGNGEPKKGLCHKVAMQSTLLGWVVAFGGTAMVVVTGILVKILMK